MAILFRIIIAAFLVASIGDLIFAEFVVFNINASSKLSKLPHFWESTGLCPPEPHQEAHRYLLSPDMQQNVALIGAMPGQRFKQIRVHWLLDLVESINQNGDINFDFKFLDEFIHLLKVNRLKPGFEIMGNPSNIFDDFENKTQVYLWKRLVNELSSRYVSKYGIDFVREWNFESWNEPNNRDFDGLNFTFNSFNNYLDACSSGLKETSNQLRFGGVSQRCVPIRKKSICISILDHIANGRNYFSGLQNDTKLDFIALHEKGIENDIDVILEKEKTVIDVIRSRCPQLSDRPIVNNECDPIARWSQPYTWNADSTYASIAIEILIKHIHYYYRNNGSTKFELLSNDNAFLSYYPYQFEQRTLLARFQINNTKPASVQFIKKPIYTAIALLDLLGDELLFSDFVLKENTVVSAVSTSENQSIFAILVSTSPNKTRQTNETIPIKLKFNFRDSVVTQTWRWRQYTVNNLKTNPYKYWKSKGKPAFPSESLLNEMRTKEGPAASNIHQLILNDRNWVHKFTSNSPEVSLFIFCSKTDGFDEKIGDFRAISVSKASVLFVWSPVRNKCINTYKVEYSETKRGEFTVINEKPLIFASFQYSPTNRSLHGYYRVSAVDFWHQKSRYSRLVYL